MMWMHWGYPGWGMMGLGFILMILFWGVFIGLVVWGVRHYRHNNYQGNGNAALNIARERYARGEINKEQFEQLKKDLGN
jgi:putative membrane protein